MQCSSGISRHFASVYFIISHTELSSRYKEVCRPGYDFRFPNNQQQGTGHFTQVVWKGSTELGIGKADVHQNGGRCTYIVARYKPAGNFIGKFGQHVAIGSFKRSIYCQKVTGNKPAGFADNRDEYIL